MVINTKFPDVPLSGKFLTGECHDQKFPVSLSSGQTDEYIINVRCSTKHFKIDDLL